MAGINSHNEDKLMSDTIFLVAMLTFCLLLTLHKFNGNHGKGMFTKSNLLWALALLLIYFLVEGVMSLCH